MTSLVLSFYNHGQQRLETIDSYMADSLLYSATVRNNFKLMLKCPATDLFKTECMMRGLSLMGLTELEPGERISLLGSSYIIHLSNEFPDFNNDHEVWIDKP